MNEIDAWKFEKNYVGRKPSATERPDLVAIFVEAKHHLKIVIENATTAEAIKYQEGLLALQEAIEQ